MRELSVEPIARASLVDIVRTRLIDLIQQSELKPDDRIVESHLARSLGVSRSPVREALRQLEQQGLVTSSVNRGYSVTRLDADDYRDLTVIRIALEKAAVGLIIDGGKREEAAARLMEIVGEMEGAATSAPNLARLTVLDWRFHEELCRLSGNKRLAALQSSMAGQIALALAAIRAAFPLTANVATRHAELVEAVATGDRPAAEHAIEEHILAAYSQHLETRDGEA
jgi:DNA-binding GntR family transcriptional regulator